MMKPINILIFTTLEKIKRFIFLEIKILKANPCLAAAKTKKRKSSA